MPISALHVLGRVTDHQRLKKEYMANVRYLQYSKICLFHHQCNPFPCVFRHLFSCPLDHFLCVLHSVIWHPVYSDTKYLSQWMPDLTGFTVFQCCLPQHTLTLAGNPPATWHTVLRRPGICLCSQHGTALTGSDNQSQKEGHPRGRWASYWPIHLEKQ